MYNYIGLLTIAVALVPLQSAIGSPVPNLSGAGQDHLLRIREITGIWQRSKQRDDLDGQHQTHGGWKGEAASAPSTDNWPAPHDAVELTEREPIDSDGQNWKRSKDQRDSLGDSTKGHHETNRRWMGAAASVPSTNNEPREAAKFAERSALGPDGTHILNRAADRDWRRLARRSREQRGDLNSANGQHEPNRRWMGAAAPVPRTEYRPAPWEASKLAERGQHQTYGQPSPDEQ